MSSSVGLGQGHTCCPARVARCFRGAACPYLLRGSCWFSHDDDPEEDPPCRDVAATSCRVGAATASLGLPGRVRRLERIVEQIGGVLVPLASKGNVDGLVGEQIGAVPVPQIWEPIGEVVQLSPRERVQNRTLEQVMDSSMPPIMEVSLPFVPQERVQNRTRLSRLWVSPCLRSWKTACRLYHRNACRIARRRRLWISLCLRSRRNACRIGRWSSSWVSLCLRSQRTVCRSSHRIACKIVRQSRLWGSLCLRSFRKACRIVRWSRSWFPLCLRPWRQSWKFLLLHNRSAC